MARVPQNGFICEKIVSVIFNKWGEGPFVL